MIFHMIGTQFWPAQLTDAGTKLILTSTFNLYSTLPGAPTRSLQDEQGIRRYIAW